MSLAEVRDGLAAVTVTGWDFKPFIPDTISPPTLAVGRIQVQYDKSMGGLLELTATVHGFASRADSQDGQDRLYPLMEKAGLKALLEADRTLGGACEELRVEMCEGPGLVDVAGTQFWSSSWTVRVWV